MKTIEPSHSAANEKAFVHTVDTSELQKAYPSPKSASQKAHEAVLIRHYHDERRPPHPVIKSTLVTSLLFCVMIMLVGNLEQLLWSNPLFGVPFWFGMMFALFICWRMFLRYILEVFSAYNVSVVPFAVTYIVGFCVISVGIVQGGFGAPGSVQSFGIALGIHSILVVTTLGFFLRPRGRVHDR